MSLAGAELTTISAPGLGMKIWLLVDNPNSFDIQIRTVRAQTVLQGQRTSYPLPPIDYSPGVWLPSSQKSPMWVPVTIPWSAVMALAYEIPFTPQVPYFVQGYADVTASSTAKLDKDAVQFSAQGFIPRQTLLNAAANSSIPH
jgi:hypothetical protein